MQRALDALMVEHAGVAIVIAHRLTTIRNCDKIGAPLPRAGRSKRPHGTLPTADPFTLRGGHSPARSDGGWRAQW